MGDDAKLSARIEAYAMEIAGSSLTAGSWVLAGSETALAASQVEGAAGTCESDRPSPVVPVWHGIAAALVAAAANVAAHACAANAVWHINSNTAAIHATEARVDRRNFMAAS